MARDPRRFVGLAFLLAAALSLLAGIVLLIRGGRANAAFLAIALVWLVLVVAKLRRPSAPASPPPALSGRADLLRPARPR